MDLPDTVIIKTQKFISHKGGPLSFLAQQKNHESYSFHDYFPINQGK